MTSAARNMMSLPGVPSVFEDLCLGRLRWDLIHPFPTENPGDRAIGDDAVEEIAGFLTKYVDPEIVDRTARLPDGLIDELAERGYLKLTVAPALGGRGMSRFTMFRVIEAAASWSVAVGLFLAIHNGIGVGQLLPALPTGPLRELVAARVAASAVSGSADTEPQGGANQRRLTTATPTEDGAAFVLTGEKVFIGNGPVADLLTVTATVMENGEEQTRLFFVDTDTPGFTVVSWQDFMGFKGFPNGRLSLREVRVPRERMLVEERAERLTPELTFALVKGRLQIIAAPSLAIAKLCAGWSRDFMLRRSIDGKGLGEYDEIQRVLAETLADTFAIETVTHWVMLGNTGLKPVNLLLEQLAAKNITSLLCWRVVDRTMSLLAGEGFETATSKAIRAAEPVPLERSFRDARGLRIAGGVDFQLDNWLSTVVTFSYYYPEPDQAAEIDGDVGDSGLPDMTANLTSRNAAHLRAVTGEIRAFATTCLRLSRKYSREELFAGEHQMILLSRIASELLTMSLVLARTSSLEATGQDTQDLADIYCASSRHRVADWQRQLAEPDGPDHAAAAAGWLRGDRFDALNLDVITPLSMADEETDV